MRRTRLVGGPWSMFCHRLQQPRLTALTRPNLPRQNGSSGSYCLHAATGFPQPAATGHCSHRLERGLLPSCSYRLSTTSGHRPLQPQAFHNHAAAGHFRHRLSMRPHAMYRGRRPLRSAPNTDGPAFGGRGGVRGRCARRCTARDTCHGCRPIVNSEGACDKRPRRPVDIAS